MSQPLRNTPNAHRLLLRMPVAVRSTFSAAQIEAIELALVPRTHKVDVRFLLPMLGKGAYCVLAAGPNRRSAMRQGEGQAAFSSREGAMEANPAFARTPHAYRMLRRISGAIATTFTHEQIAAIETALIPRKHLIDVRIPLPLMGKGAYVIIAAGPNKRSHYKDIQNGNPFVMPTVVASVTVAALSLAGLVQLRGSALLKEEDPVFANEKFHPTVVPFKKNRNECLESGRQWIDNQCIDKVHDPDF